MSYTKINKAGERDRIAGLLAHASSVGVRRKAVETILASIGEQNKGPAFRVDYGSGSAVIGAAGTVQIAELGEDLKPVKGTNPVQGWLHPLLADVPAGATFGTKQIGKIVIPSGLCLVVGGGGVGKTPLCHALAGYGRDNYGVVRAGEPLAGYSVDHDVVSASLGVAMYECDSIVLDSIKDLLAKGGSAMKSGISRSALVEMTAWSILAHALGVTLYVPLNPSSDDKEVVALMVEAARSNATSTIAYSGGDERSSQWTYYARQGEALPRRKAMLNMRTAGGVPVVSDGTVGEIATLTDAQGSLEIKHFVTPSAFSGALARSVTRDRSNS